MKNIELIALRKSCGFTQEEVGKHLGLKKASYCKKENGKCAFTLKDIIIIQKLFNMSFLQVWHIFFDYNVEIKTTQC